MAFLSRPICTSFLRSHGMSVRNVKLFHAKLIINGVVSPFYFAKLIEHCCLNLFQHGISYARSIFSSFDRPDIYLFNTLLRCVPPKDSIQLFCHRASRGGLVDDFTFIFTLGACARSPSLSTLWIGKQVHARAARCGFLSNAWVQTTAVHFYSSNRDVGSARHVFNEILTRSTVSWNAMITGYCSQSGKSSDSRDALLLFQDMLVDAGGAKPTGTTMVCVLSASSNLGVLETGTCVHGYVEKTFHQPENDVYLGTGLVDLYSKCGCLDTALCIFKRMQEKNVLTWTAMTTGLAIHGRGEEALEYLNAMGTSGVKPNSVTFTSLLFACCNSGLVEEGMYLFHCMTRKFNITPDMQHYGCIVDLLGRAGRLKEAYEFIQAMPVEPDTILWRSLMSACRIHHDVLMGEKVGKLLLQLQLQSPGASPGACEDYVALSNVYATAEKWEDVEMVRRAMKVEGVETKAGCSVVSSCNYTFP